MPKYNPPAAPKVGREHPAALAGDVNAQLAHRVHGMLRRRLAVHGADARRKHLEFPASLDGGGGQRSAMGLRQTFPVQMNKMVFIPREGSK